MRKEQTVLLEDDGRELMFKITQMSAVQQERWINRLLLMLAGSGNLDNALDALQSNVKAGEYGNIIRLLGALKYEDAEPLYDELLECCAHIPDRNNTRYATKLTRGNADSIIGDFKTLYKLRIEALKLNFGFFAAGEKSPKERREPEVRITKRT